MRKLFGLAALGCWATAAQAQEPHGPYVGVSAGSFSFEQNQDGPLGIPFSDSSAAYRLFGGYQLNSVYGIEAGWAKAGDFTDTLRVYDQTGGELRLEMAADYEIATLRFVALAPFSSINMYGALGYYDAKLNVRGRLSTPTDVVEAVVIEAEQHTSDSGATVAGGVQFDLKRFSIRGEYEWFNTKSSVRASNFSVGILFLF